MSMLPMNPGRKVHRARDRRERTGDDS